MASAEPYVAGGTPAFYRRAAHASRRGMSAEDHAKGANVGYSERIVSSVAGAALAAIGLTSRRPGALALAGLGGALIYRGMTGRCPAYRAMGVNTARSNAATVIPAKHGDKVEKSIVIAQSPGELYSFWRELENLPRVMTHLKSVEPIDRVRSHWVAAGPLGRPIEWDAEIFNDTENEMIAWRSIPGGDVDTAGSVHFRALDAGRGTEVTVSLKYDPPAGKVGAWIASVLGSDPDCMIEEDLRRFKELMETGEVPTPESQSGGRS